MSKLFSSYNMGGLSLKNRLIIPPMCQYSAHNSHPNAWHYVHYGMLANSGASLLIIEATAVSPEGRITPYDLGLWDRECKKELTNLVNKIRSVSTIKLGIQLGHAGRKGSMPLPWSESQEALDPHHEGWEVLAPSEIPFDHNSKTPISMTTEQINSLIHAFTDAAIRAEESGFDLIEIHAAHGYLIHQFLSPISNQRTDEYGGSFDNRIRLLIQIFSEIKKTISKHIVLGVRISATDWIEKGWDLESSIDLSKKLEILGCDFIHVSSGGLSPDQKIDIKPNYQIPFAEAIKQKVELPTIAVGLITKGSQAESILAHDQADLIAIGRGMLFDPHWGWRAAQELNETIQIPPQYLRALPK